MDSCCGMGRGNEQDVGLQILLQQLQSVSIPDISGDTGTIHQNDAAVQWSEAD